MHKKTVYLIKVMNGKYWLGNGGTPARKSKVILFINPSITSHDITKWKGSLKSTWQFTFFDQNSFFNHRVLGFFQPSSSVITLMKAIARQRLSNAAISLNYSDKNFLYQNCILHFSILHHSLCWSEGWVEYWNNPESRNQKPGFSSTKHCRSYS